MEESEIWLESEMEELVKDLIPKKISDKITAEEIRNFPKRMDDTGKQNIRAKNYGWNLCVEEMKKRSQD
jgi:CO dehydrogenase/acetyl-CoA synthase beta subunit